MLTINLNYVSFSQLGAAIKQNLYKVPQSVQLVVGIPRSGMIPAYMVGLYRNLPVTDLASFVANQKLAHGNTRKLKINLSSAHAAKSILLIDDSYSTGNSFNEALAKVKASGFKGTIVTCAAITLPGTKKALDVTFMEVKDPRVFEWNIFHHAIIANSCFDMDGVLCEDPTETENDDGPKYLKFLEGAAPRFIPTQPIAHIVSARLEKYRPQTEAWLKRHGVQYGKLHLINLPSAAERIRTNAHHGHKSSVYSKTKTDLFIESELTQAIHIAAATGKPVLCTETMELITGSGIHLAALPMVVKQRAIHMRRWATSFLPKPVKTWLKQMLIGKR